MTIDLNDMNFGGRVWWSNILVLQPSGLVVLFYVE